MNTDTLLGKFRLVGILEGISFLFLMGIAVPIKYMAGNPWPVKIGGWIHGIFFILYLVMLYEVWKAYKWSFAKVFWGVVAALLPFGTFILDRKLAKE